MLTYTQLVDSNSCEYSIHFKSSIWPVEVMTPTRPLLSRIVRAVSCAIGNFVLWHKNAPLRIALRRSGRMSLKRPAAGGESCLQDSFSYYKRKSLKNNIYHVTLKTFAPAKECRLRDLNPHGIATNGFWVHLVCHSDKPAPKLYEIVIQHWLF